MGKFKDTKLHALLKQNLPHVLSLVGDVVPGAGVLRVVSRVIENSTDISDEGKLEMLKEVDLERVKVEGFNELETVQLQQDDLVTKRARPIRQYAWIILLFLCYPLAAALSGQPIDLPEILLIGMFSDMGVYSLLRTAEKTGLPIKAMFNKIFKKNE